MSSMRYPITPEIHEAIVKIYHGETDLNIAFLHLMAGATFTIDTVNIQFP